MPPNTTSPPETTDTANNATNDTNTPSGTAPNTSNSNTTGTISANKSSNNCRNIINNNTNTNKTHKQIKFKGKNEELAVLGIRLERGNKPDQFIIFCQSIKHHIGTAFNNPADLDPVIVNLINPIKNLMIKVPKELTLVKELGYDVVTDVHSDMTSTIASVSN